MEIANPRPVTQIFGNSYMPNQRQISSRNGANTTAIEVSRTPPVTSSESQTSLQRVPSPHLAGPRQSNHDRPEISIQQKSYLRQNVVPYHKMVSVWSQYSKDYPVNYGGEKFWMAEPPDGGISMIQTQNPSNIKQKIALLQKLQCQFFVRCMGVFESNSDAHFVLEHMNISLVQVAAALRPPTEKEILAIVGQLTQGLRLMIKNNVVHGQLTLSNVLVNLRGEVKLLLPDTYKVSNTDRTLVQKDIQSLGQVVCQLATRSSDPTSHSGQVEGSYSSTLLDFIAATHTNDIDSLLMHPFLATKWKCEDLHRLFYLASVSSRVQVG